MSHQTGIKGDDSLRSFFTHCHDGKIRFVKISIQNEKLTVSKQEQVKGDWEKDYAKWVPTSLEENQPAFILFRLDSKSSMGHEWLLITYSPDTAPVRQKMIYAGTRATLKSEFGAVYIRDEYHCTTTYEASLDNYKRHLKSKTELGPMTRVEEELMSVKLEERTQQQRAVAANTLASQTLRGVAFPIDQIAQEKLAHLRDDKINYVQLSVDTLNEAIKLEKTGCMDIPELNTSVPKNHPRYHFYRYKHMYEGVPHNSVVFIYSMPHQAMSTVKERMLYSSCKAPFLTTVENFLQLRIDRKIEIDATEEISDDFLMDQCHPKISLNQPLFPKPKPPGSRGPRLTRPVQ